MTPIQNLTAECIERWHADLLVKGKPGPRSVEICKTALGTMLKDARMKGRLYVNPMEAVRRFDVPKRELHYLTAEQVKGLCERVGRVYGVLFLVMAFCGLRIGEVLGLQWPDLDLSQRRLFQPALTALGLTGIRMHDFRRTFIALHVEAGTHPKLVQERVGHSNIKLTMDVYGTLAGKMALAEEQTARLDSSLHSVPDLGQHLVSRSTQNRPKQPKTDRSAKGYKCLTNGNIL